MKRTPAPETIVEDPDEFGLDDFLHEGGPSRVFSVRFAYADLERLNKVAAFKGVAPSALVRTWTLLRVEAEYGAMLGICSRCGRGPS